MLAHCPRRDTVRRWRLDVTGAINVSASRNVAGIRIRVGVSRRCVFVLLEPSSQVPQTALKLLNILPRHRGVRSGLALVLALDVTAYKLSVGIVRYGRI